MLIAALFVGIAICAFGRRWWWVGIGIAICFGVRIMAPAPPPEIFTPGVDLDIHHPVPHTEGNR